MGNFCCFSFLARRRKHGVLVLFDLDFFCITSSIMMMIMRWGEGRGCFCKQQQEGREGDDGKFSKDCCFPFVSPLSSKGITITFCPPLFNPFHVVQKEL